MDVLPSGEVSAWRAANHPCRLRVVNELQCLLTVLPEVEVPWVAVLLERPQVKRIYAVDIELSEVHWRQPWCDLDHQIPKRSVWLSTRKLCS